MGGLLAGSPVRYPDALQWVAGTQGGGGRL